MLDSRGFIHVPKPIRIAALLLLGAVLFSAILVTVYYVSLENPKDIAMMTESFWRTAIRNNIALSTEEPSPL